MKDNFFEILQNKKILVTGGAGFIGSNLCETLLDLGAKVTCLDNFSTGSKSNIAHLDGKVRTLDGDIRNIELIDRLTQDFAMLPDVHPDANRGKRCRLIIY